VEPVGGVATFVQKTTLKNSGTVDWGMSKPSLTKTISQLGFRTTAVGCNSSQNYN